MPTVAEAAQDIVCLSWKADGTARDLRAWLGSGLRNCAKFEQTEWLFHKANDKPIPDLPAMCRFFASPGRVGINFVGGDAIAKLQSALLTILGAGRSVGLDNPDIRAGVIWAKPADHPVKYLANCIVLRKLRLQNCQHPSEEIISRHLKRAVANSINLQATCLGLASPLLAVDDVGVETVFKLGSTKLENGGRPMTIPRLTRAVLTLPLYLEGPWYVGGLASHGNGYIKRLDQIAQYRPEMLDQIGEPA